MKFDHRIDRLRLLHAARQYPRADGEPLFVETTAAVLEQLADADPDVLPGKLAAARQMFSAGMRRFPECRDRVRVNLIYMACDDVPEVPAQDDENFAHPANSPALAMWCPCFAHEPPPAPDSDAPAHEEIAALARRIYWAQDHLCVAPLADLLVRAGMPEYADHVMNVTLIRYGLPPVAGHPRGCRFIDALRRQ